METKTDMEPDIHLTVEPTMTVGEVHKEVEKRMGWLPTSQLKRWVGHPSSGGNSTSAGFVALTSGGQG